MIAASFWILIFWGGVGNAQTTSLLKFDTEQECIAALSAVERGMYEMSSWSGFKSSSFRCVEAKTN